MIFIENLKTKTVQNGSENSIIFFHHRTKKQAIHPVKIAILLNHITDEKMNIYNTFMFGVGESVKTFDAVMKYLKDSSYFSC